MEEAQVTQMDALGMQIAKYGEPPAYKEQLLRSFLRVERDFVKAGAEKDEGGGKGGVMVFVSRAVVPQVGHRVVIPEKHRYESSL